MTGRRMGNALEQSYILVPAILEIAEPPLWGGVSSPRQAGSGRTVGTTVQSMSVTSSGTASLTSCSVVLESMLLTPNSSPDPSGRGPTVTICGLADTVLDMVSAEIRLVSAMSRFGSSLF